jgi:hypothetical protein
MQSPIKDLSVERQHTKSQTALMKYRQNIRKLQKLSHQYIKKYIIINRCSL